MIIKNFNKFEVDYRRNETSVGLFEDLYINRINNILLVKIKNLLEVFNIDLRNSKTHNSYIAYVEYIFPILIKKVNDMLEAYYEMERKKVHIPNNLHKDIDIAISIRNQLETILDSNTRRDIDERRIKILQKYYSSILENVDGFTSTLLKVDYSQMLGKDNIDLLSEINNKVNQISLDSSYETHNILISECIDELEREIYKELLYTYDELISRISMVITKTKFDVNTLKMMGNVEDIGLLSNLLYYIHDIEYFIQALVIFHDLSSEKTVRIEMEEFKSIYNEGLNGETKPYLREKLKIIINDYKFFYENYKEFAILPKYSKKINYVVNKIIFEMEQYLSTNKFDDNEVKTGLKESLEIKLNNIKKNFENTPHSDDELYKFLKEIILKEVHYLDELRNLSLKELDEIYEENFILGFEELYYKIVIALKICDVEVYEPFIGEQFNSKSHIVEFVKPSEKYRKGCVIDVLYNGFEIEGNVVLEARVVCVK